MSLFSISMQTPKPALVEALKTATDEHHLVHDRLMIVRSSKSAKQLIDAVVIPDTEKSGFMIAQITADYYGYASTSFWNWLQAAFRADTDG